MHFFGQRNLKIDIQHCFLQVYNDNMRKYTHNIKKFFTINFVELPTKKKKKEKKFFKKNWWNLVNKKIKKNKKNLATDSKSSTATYIEL